MGIDGHDGRRDPGRWEARAHRRRPAGGRGMRVYHHRVRDGVPVVWCWAPPWIRTFAPAERVVAPLRVAEAVLADALGDRPRAERLAPAWLDGPGAAERWDWTDEEIREWADRSGPRRGA